MPNSLDITQFPMFEDNYGYLLRDPKSGKVATIDPGDAQAVIGALEHKQLKLDEIWITHHHADHTGGNSELKKRYGARVLGPKAEAGKIPEIDGLLTPGEKIQLGELEAVILDVGGHTLGHIAYYFAKEKALFCGDAVFGLGCGRLFEGSPHQMWASLNRIAVLPEDTLLYCAHEYLESNMGFALAVDPQNPILEKRLRAALALRAQGLPTVPLKLEEEKNTNPFFRPMDPLFLSQHFPNSHSGEVFADLRARRNVWRS